MLMIVSWWLVLLQAVSALGGSGQPGFCEGVPGTASSQSSSASDPGKRGALQGANFLPAHMADLAGAQPVI